MMHVSSRRAGRPSWTRKQHILRRHCDWTLALRSKCDKSLSRPSNINRTFGILGRSIMCEAMGELL